ncbi:uncharacterized protein LOC126616936 [Malus sylvestris]|uniref:uncharacterized protein LOC126616936 n=1 Tax=Malus sylvestris TaxID=3752 RepID=UPI0021AC486C|nr:uncharacterized protein LOC126616936 [Malus sylvestris]
MNTSDLDQALGMESLNVRYSQRCQILKSDKKITCCESYCGATIKIDGFNWSGSKVAAAPSALICPILHLQPKTRLYLSASIPLLSSTALRDYMATSRNWIDHEENVQLTILEEMVADGVRCETGSFKADTFVMVASKMREQIPDINIEPKHIQNKLKRLKEKYSYAYDMMNTSGFGWDDEKKCVVVDSDEILQEWVKKHPNASCKPNKSFPLYPR